MIHIDRARIGKIVAAGLFVMPMWSSAEIETKVRASDGSVCIEYESTRYLGNPTVSALNKCDKRITVYAIKPRENAEAWRSIFLVEAYDATKGRPGTGFMMGSSTTPPTVVSECVSLDRACTRKWNGWMRSKAP